MFHAFKATASYAVAMFFPPIDVQQALVQHTQSMSVPIRHPSDKTSIVTSFETNISIHRKRNKIPGTYTVYSRVWRLWGVFLEYGGGALGIFKSPVFALTSSMELLFVRFSLCFLPEQA